MNDKEIKEIKRKNILKNIFICFLCLQPLLDFNFLYSNKILEIFNFSPSTIIRISMVFLLFFQLFFSKKNWKNNKKILIYIIIICIYVVLHHINSCFLFSANNTGTFNYNIVSEMFYLLRMFIPIIIIFITNNFKFKFNEKKKIFNVVTLIFSIIIILSSIFKFGLTTYGDGIINKNFIDVFNGIQINPYDFATKGLFNGGNRLGVLLLALLPINIYYMQKSNKIIDYFVVILQILSMILVGTRVSTYGWILVVIMYLVVYMFFIFLKKEKINYKKIFLILLFSIICLFFVFNSPMLKRQYGIEINQSGLNVDFLAPETGKDKVETPENEINKPENGNEMDHSEIEKPHANNNEEKNKLEKEQFILDNYAKYHIHYQYVYDIYNYKYDPDFWILVMKNHGSKVNNGRYIQKLISDRIYDSNNNFLDISFGMGYSRFKNGGLYLERDIIVHFYTIGLCGLLLFILLPYCGVLFKYILYIIPNFKKNINFETAIYCSSLCLFIAFSLINGHVLDEMITYIFIAFISGIILNNINDNNEFDTVKSKEKDLISIIVPIFNCEEYLEECLDSIVNQTYGIDNLDVILIDDCSTDNSFKIAQSYSKKYDFKLHKNKENMGLASTRNIGMDLSIGKYLYFLDSDDILYESAIYDLHNHISNTDSDVAISKLNSFNSTGQYGYYSDKYMNEYKFGTIYENKELLNCISVCSKLYKSDLIKNNKIYFLKNTCHEDISFTITVFFKSKKIIVVPKYLYYRRVRENNSSIMQNLNFKTYQDAIKNYKYAYSKLERNRMISLNFLVIRKLSNYIINNLAEDEYKEALNKTNTFIKESISTSFIYSMFFKFYFNFTKILKKYNLIKYIRKNKNIFIINEKKEKKTNKASIYKKIKNNKIIKEIKFIYKYIKNIKMILNVRKINILNDKKSIDLIIKSKKSVARYGDGELNFIFNKNNKIGFQDSSEDLAKRLTRIIHTKSDNVLIGLPNKFITLINNRYDSKTFWLDYMIENNKKLLEEIDLSREYINTNFTRFYMDYKFKTFTKKKIKNIKKIWNNREIVIIEGEQTKLGVGNNFFDNAKSIERIICPNKNAFSLYEKILKEAKRIPKNKLILIALGPTATVLAYDLGMLGYQAIDVGHVDIEYEWYLIKAKEKVAIAGKHVNEAKENKNNVSIEDEKYIKSIIKTIK